jgi:hypothetical protein
MIRIRPALLLIALVSTAGLAQGCASLIHGSTQQIALSSTPSGATVVINGLQRLQTPTTVELPRKETHQLEFKLDGYHSETIWVRHVTSNMIAGNIIAGGLIGFVVDHSTGAAFRLVPEVVQVDLRPIAADPQNAAAPNTPAEKISSAEPDAAASAP